MLNQPPSRNVTEPSGVLDATDATYTALDERRVRVSGAVYRESDTYTVKLEGSRMVGYQTIAIGGIRDRVVIEQLPELLPKAKEYFRAKIRDIFTGQVDPDDIDIDYRLYGRNAGLGALDPDRDRRSHELGVLITITAPTQPTAHAIATFVTHGSSHLPIPQYEGLASTIAFPFSPPETGLPVHPQPRRRAVRPARDVPHRPRRGGAVTRLLDLCSLIRSKNAGPYVLTFDFMCHDQQSYDTLRSSGLLNPQLFAELYGSDPEHVLVVHHDRAQAVKVSMPRRVCQGDIHDPDSYGGQQYAPLVDLEVPQL